MAETWTTKRARLAAMARHGNADVDEARRDFEIAKLQDRFRKLVDDAPPLTVDEIATLRRLLPCPGFADDKATEQTK